MSSDSLSTASKFSSPPTIANYQRHEDWIQLLKRSYPKRKDLDLNASEIPLHLQAFANECSLRPSKEEAALQKEAQGLPMSMMVGGPDEANFLCLLLEMANAKKVVEVGVFRGVSTLSFAKCLQALHPNKKDVKVVGLDISAEYAEVGQKYWKQAGVEDIIDLRIGDATESLSKLLEEDGAENSFDMAFIDADKTSYDDYYEKCLKLVKSGGLIVVDNTLWAGTIAIPDDTLEFLTKKEYSSDDSSEEAVIARRALGAIAIKRLVVKIHQDERIDRVSFLTIADGVTICRKK